MMMVSNMLCHWSVVANWTKTVMEKVAQEKTNRSKIIYNYKKSNKFDKKRMMLWEEIGNHKYRAFRNEISDKRWWHEVIT